MATIVLYTVHSFPPRHRGEVFILLRARIYLFLWGNRVVITTSGNCVHAISMHIQHIIIFSKFSGKQTKDIGEFSLRLRPLYYSVVVQLLAFAAALQYLITSPPFPSFSPRCKNSRNKRVHSAKGLKNNKAFKRVRERRRKRGLFRNWKTGL